MARLGELLVAAGLLDADKLEQALRAQVVWGGRLGTNLVELGFIDLDELSRALGELHGVPAALARHFERADPALQQRVVRELADRHSFVPLVELADCKIAIACIDPLAAAARAEVAHALGIDPAHLVISVAAEQRMRYQLERVYNIARAARYLRSRGKSLPPFLPFGEFSSEPDSEVEIPIVWDQEPAPPASPADASAEDAAEAAEAEAETVVRVRKQSDALTALIDSAIAAAPEVPELAGRERRTFLKTLADEPPAAGTLARIAIRKVAVGAAPDGGAAPPLGVSEAPADDAPDATLPETAKAIRRGTHRDRVAKLVVAAVERFAPACTAAVLLIVRGDTATAWQHFARDGAPMPDIAVPVDQPGLVTRARDLAATARDHVGALGAIDRRLLQALGAEDGDLVVVPIAIAGRVLCVIACAAAQGSAIADIETIATSAGTAFARLIRDAGR